MSQKSILTTAMEKAQAAKAAMVAKMGDGEEVPLTEEQKAKKALKKFGITIAATVAATAVTLVALNAIANKMDDGEEAEDIEDIEN